ncbi:hypothetical protein EVA_21438 [gut metagenome]|uniref:Lin1244/Lin1753-like N-terminal domain-containing protein n=1 Tax=gut metagenome TaxID=749906 RepID=J9BSA5_9ZZZZ
MQSGDMKKVYYFPHDFNARNDPKLQDVMIELGLEGIGAYWCMIEQLYEQEGQLPVKALKGIAFTLHMDFSKLQRLITEFDLFLIEGDVLTSPAVTKRREAMIEKSNIAKMKIAKRWKKKADNEDTNVSTSDTGVSNSDTDVIQMYKTSDTGVSNSDTDVIPIKENKIKEKKEDNISSNDDKSNMPLDSSVGGVNYQGIIQFYNSTMEQSGATIPKVKSIEGMRKKHVSARIREYGRNAFADMIRKAAASDFLNGRNERGFTATFDWLIRPANFVKVIEGNYDSNKNYSNGNPRANDNQRRGTLEVSATSADDYKTTF